MTKAVKRTHRALFVLLSGILILNISLSGCSILLARRMDNHDYQVITDSKGLFDAIYDSLYKFEENVYVKTSSYDEFMEFWRDLDDQLALHSVFREQEISISYMEKNDECCVDMHMKMNTCGQAMQYLYAKNVTEYPTPEAEKLGEELLATKEALIDDNMSDEEKVRAIHNYLICNTEYAVDRDVNLYSTADVLLEEGMAQCQGYTEAFTALCLLSGLECKAISGSSTFGFGERAHAWSQVKVNSIWYHIDVTWDDPIPDCDGLVCYDFYLKGDTMMMMTHEWSSYFEECYMDYVD